jgi:hypothetical protein
MQDMFVPSLIAIGLLVLGKKIFFQYKHTVSEYGFPIVAPPDTRGP